MFSLLKIPETKTDWKSYKERKSNKNTLTCNIFNKHNFLSNILFYFLQNVFCSVL